MRTAGTIGGAFAAATAATTTVVAGSATASPRPPRSSVVLTTTTDISKVGPGWGPASWKAAQAVAKSADSSATARVT